MRFWLLCKVIVSLLFVITITASISFGTSCLSGWKYKKQIQIANPGNLLTDYQALFEFNSASYVAQGKMNISGSDIRFMDTNNNILSYWIVPGTFNSTKTQVWIKVSAILNGTTNIFMFYGNNSAYTKSNGNETFIFFDDFKVGASNWEICGGGYYVENGTLNIYSTNANNKALLSTQQSFAAPYTSEMHLKSRNGDDATRVSIVQINSNGEGFGLTSIESGSNTEMEISRYDNDADCFSYATAYGNAGLTSSINGVWEFTWYSPNTQQGIKGENDVKLQYNDDTYSYPTDLHTGIAIYGSSSSAQIDWLRIRKWATNELTLTLSSTEEVLPDASNINPGSNSPLCQGETLSLFAEDIENANYTWYKPDGTVLSTDVVPGSFTAYSTHAGKYQLIVEPYNGSCTTITMDIDVEVYAESDAGAITGEKEVCSGHNFGYLELQNYTGEIIRWEYSTTGGDPWASIDNNSSRQNYQNLSQTTYYRAVVKNGECSQDKSDIATVTVSAKSSAGTALDDAVLCKNESTNISLVNSVGDDIYWEKSADNLNWNSTLFYSANFNTGNLDTTTYYRAIVSNGVCEYDTSNVVTIKINCPSEGGIVEKDTVCKGSTGSIALNGYTGNVLRWEESVSGGKPWTTIPETGNILEYENITQTKYYRTVINSPGCDTVYSEIGWVIVDQLADKGSISGNATVCYQANSGEIILTDYSGKITSWEFSEDNQNSWHSISSVSDTLEYSNLEQTTYYRAHIETEFNICSDIYSSSVKVTVNEPTLAGDISGATTVCSDENTGKVELNSYRGDIVRWEKSVTGKSPWDVIAINADSLVYNDLVQNTFYRAVVQNGVCGALYTDSVLVQVSQKSDAGIITGIESHCAEVNQGTLQVKDYTGNIVKWEKSTDNLTWLLKTFTQPNTISYSNLNETNYYRLIVKNGVCPADTSEIANIVINPLPVVNFKSDTVELGHKTHFTNLSAITSGNLTEFQWDFGNGEGSIAANPAQLFDISGTYSVLLKAKSDKNCLDSVRKDVRVLPKPSVDFGFSNVCLGDTMLFSNQSNINNGTLSFEWDFGDGATSNEDNPFKFYQSSGEFVVTLTATSNDGVQSSVTKTVEVYHRAILDFNLDDVCSGIQVAIRNNSTIPDGALTYHWNFGDGEHSSSINPVHTYNQHADYEITLITTSDYNCKDTLAKTISIYPNPVADFHTDNVPYKTVSEFTDYSTIESGAISAWNWNFGDGSFSNSQNPDYVYNTPGTYEVSLSVASDYGCTSIHSKNVKIYPLPSASFTFGNVCDKQPVEFINQTTVLSGELSYLWDFGDEETSTETHPVHLYQSHGTYHVTLIVTSEANGKDTIQKLVEIYPLPETDFEVDDVCDGYPSAFSNLSTIQQGSINSNTWDFGDGTNSIQTNPLKQYVNAGEYTVELTSVSDKACVSRVQKNAFVRKNPLADFYVANVCLGKEVYISNHSVSDEGNISFYWDFGDGKNSVLQNPNHHYAGSGVYSVKLITRTSYQCVDSLLRNVVVYRLPEVDAGLDTSVSKGFKVMLQASGANIFDWSPAESLDNPGIFNPVARPMETTTYSVRGIDVNGCENTDDVTVAVKDDYQVIASNILTPDYNGMNDTWKITNIDAFESATVYIFNRWGEEVYSRKGYKNDWDGRNSNGDVLPDGTYYYIIKFTDSTKHYSGSITLMRNQ